MTRLRLDYVHEYLDRHGKLRRYFRRPGFKRIPLPGAPGSDEFMTAYQLALAGQPPRPEIGAGRTKPGTVNAAIVGYYSSEAFRALAPGTQKLQRSILERFRAEHGDKRVALLPREFVIRALGKRRPSVARNWLKTLRALLRFAIAEGFRADDPTQGVKPPRIKTDGIHTWTEDEIARYEARHPIGTKARLALALLLYTAQRRSDVVRMGRQHVRNGMIAVRQQKTGAMLQIPVHPNLQEALDGLPEKQLTFLVTEFGKPFSFAGFGNWFRDRCKEAGLPKKCSAHGLRKAACRRLAEAGCSAHQIRAISGHASLREVERYTKAADQAELARQASPKNNGEHPLANLGDRLAKLVRKPLKLLRRDS
jgi:integrase